MSKKPKSAFPLVADRQTGKSAASESNIESAAIRREGFESIIVAILLALLFRGFEAEAFIIPTGSMAPTLQGMHKDLRCPQCSYRYRVNQPEKTLVAGSTCPMCRFETPLDPKEHPSFNGDRIMVNKFAYEIGDPERWDVIVFKFPGNAKQNYIKRLVGLPGETLRVSGGDVFAKPNGESDFKILRKPADVIPRMLQLVHDTRYIPSDLIKAKWPSRWHVPEGAESEASWAISENQREYRLGSTEKEAWIRYRHLPPTNSATQKIVGSPVLPASPATEAKLDQWSQIRKGAWPKPSVRGRLIRDWYAYNNGDNRSQFLYAAAVPGWHWVGDLAMEANIEVTTSQGELWLDLIESGESYRCHIDAGTGVATVALPDGTTLSAKTSLKGKGTYRLMWSNLDDQVILWIDGEPVDWTSDGSPHPGHYMGKGLVGPKWSDTDPGDLLPAGIGGRNIGIVANKLKIYRDVYYTAVDMHNPTADYRSFGLGQALRTLVYPPNDIDQPVPHLSTEDNPISAGDLFADRSEVEFELEEDQFLPMGDNSPQSKDGRLWNLNDEYVATDNKTSESPNGYVFSKNSKVIRNYVERDLLIGKAIIIYWPHGWPIGPIKLPINPIPNVDRMGTIR